MTAPLAPHVVAGVSADGWDGSLALTADGVDPASIRSLGRPGVG